MAGHIHLKYLKNESRINHFQIVAPYTQDVKFEIFPICLIEQHRNSSLTLSKILVSFWGIMVGGHLRLKYFQNGSRNKHSQIVLA